MPPSQRLEAAQGWTALFLRIGSFLIGAAILFWQMVVEHLDRPYLIAAGVGLVTGSAASTLGSSLGKALRGAADALDDEK